MVGRCRKFPDHGCGHRAVVAQTPLQRAERRVVGPDVARPLRRIAERLDRRRPALKRLDAPGGGVQLAADRGERIPEADQRRQCSAFGLGAPLVAAGLVLGRSRSRIVELLVERANPRLHLHRRLLTRNE